MATEMIQMIAITTNLQILVTKVIRIAMVTMTTQTTTVMTRTFRSKTDDTKAFQRAMKEGAGKTVGVPPGDYVIRDFVHIEHAGTVLRGAGPGATRLVFPIPLEKVKPKASATTSGRPTSGYSWGGGFFVIQDRGRGEVIGKVSASAKRGGRILTVDNAGKFKAGQFIEIEQRDPGDFSFCRHIYAGSAGDTRKLKADRMRDKFAARVVAVDVPTRRIAIDRLLRLDVRPEWNPVVRTAGRQVEEAGIEGLTFHFPPTPYKGHFTELGFNAIAINGAANCWVRDVRVENSDSGIYIGGRNHTVERFVLASERPTKARHHKALVTGHHGISFYGQDCLVRDFVFDTVFIHDVTVSNSSAGNVMMEGKARDLSLDHHKVGPRANLFTDIDAGGGQRLYVCGGGASLGRHAGGWETFWNIRARRPIAPPRPDWSPPMINIVAVQPSGNKSQTDPRGRWIETIAPERMQPRNLYRAQLARRLRQ